MNTPGQRIKAEREAKGWSQQRLADEIKRIKGEKISRAAIAQWEAGTSKSQKPENFFPAAEALGLNPYWVLDGRMPKHAERGSLPVAVDAAPGVKTATALTDDEQTILAAFRLFGSEVRSMWLESARNRLAQERAEAEAPIRKRA